MIGLFKARNPQLYPKSHFQVPHVHRIRESLWNHAVCKLPKCNQNITLWLNFANQKRRKLSEKTNILDNAILNFYYGVSVVWGGEFLAVINQQLFFLMLVSEWGWWWIKQSLSFLSTVRLNRRFLWRKI